MHNIGLFADSEFESEREARVYAHHCRDHSLLSLVIEDSASLFIDSSVG